MAVTVVVNTRKHSTSTMRLVDHCYRRQVDSNHQIMTATQHNRPPGHLAISALRSFSTTT